MATDQPLILAMEASTEQCSVALKAGDELICRECDTPRSHAKVLLPMSDALLGEVGASLADVDRIAVSLGPGSFTGVRICLSVAQGLAYAGGKALAGVSSLHMLATQLYSRFVPQAGSILIPALDARMGEVYWAAYQVDSSGRLVEYQEPCVDSPESLGEFIARQSAECFGGGHGWSVQGANPIKLLDCEPSALPHAQDIMSLLAELDFRTGPQLMGVEPQYLRNEVAWEKRTRVRTQPLI